MKAKELLHQINNARQMFNTAADECEKSVPDWKVILSNLSRGRELILEAEFLTQNEVESKKDDQLKAGVDAVIEKVFVQQKLLTQQG